MIIGLQIIAVLFALFMIYASMLNYKRKEIALKEIISWVVIWSLTIFVTIFPNLLRQYAEKFAVTRLFDLMVVGGFILVIYMSSVSYLKTKKIEKKLEDYVRNSAIKNKLKSSK